MCKLSIIVGLLCLAIEFCLYWRMRKLRQKWEDETKRYRETLAKLGIPPSIL
jgi:hypothetical protein